MWCVAELRACASRRGWPGLRSFLGGHMRVVLTTLGIDSVRLHACARWGGLHACSPIGSALVCGNSAASNLPLSESRSLFGQEF
jgi:hypothetical protein